MTSKSAKPLIYRCLIINDDKGRHEVVLNKPSYSLGRERNCDIRLHSQFVSRRHATLLRVKGKDSYRIVDGDPQEGTLSSNGLRINGRRVSSHELKNGEKISFGSQVYAIYEHRRHDSFPTIPPNDPFDITLIDPSGNESQ